MNTGMIVLLALVLLIGLSIFLVFRLIKAHYRHRALLREHRQVQDYFRPITDMQAELLNGRQQIEAEADKLSGMRQTYAEKYRHLEALQDELAIIDETLSFAELGVYSPHFDFTDSETFKTEIVKVREDQKAMIKDKIAVTAETDWQVAGSAKEGKKMVDRSVKLVLRAFNNECDAAIANTRWNNAVAMEKRIQRAYEQINKLNETLHISIAHTYLTLKLRELRLVHEHKEKLKEERDHRAEMNRLKREEEKLLKEAAEAEKEEDRYQRLLAQAEQEAASGIGKDMDKQRREIEVLKQQLAEAHAKAERAQSMAQQTRAGFIYVISNIGSFGKGVFKIGMTRRLEPLDRVRELGDASVPFMFDLHAMVYCQDAPGVEKALHEHFDAHRVNRANNRKEFFRIPLDQIERAIHSFDPDAEFSYQPEAQEYFETLAIENRRDEVVTARPRFPADI